MTVASAIIKGGSQDGQAIGERATREYGLLVAQNMPPLVELARAGQIFTGSMTAAGAALPIYSNTAQVCGIWNPAGNSVDVVLLSLGITYVDTTGAAGGYCLGYLSNAPAQLATGAAITAFTEAAAINAYLNGGAASKVKFTASAATVTAPAILRHLSLNQNAFTTTGTGQMPYASGIRFDGDVILTPGTAVFVAGNIATLAKLALSLTWAEIPRI